jgi:transcriptional regulator with PAS, ATPase and Fis domain
MILLNVDYLDFAEILFFITLSVMFNIIMYSQSSSGLTILAFDKIGDILQDYVFVTNVDGNVIHKNKMANQSDLFISDEKIDIDNIKNIYRIKPDIKKNSHGNEYAKLEYKNKELYFIHKHDFLKDKEEIIGHIITIIDITNLMNLLYSLEDKKEKSKETNAKLKHYSEVVYHIEKEKEINVLLEEILYSREKEMQSLIDKINLLIQNENDFLEQIDHVVCFNQRILEDVRKAVRTYRQYYGG